MTKKPEQLEFAAEGVYMKLIPDARHLRIAQGVLNVIAKRLRREAREQAKQSQKEAGRP